MSRSMLMNLAADLSCQHFPSDDVCQCVIKAAHPTNFLVKLLLKSGQTLEGADIKSDTTGDRKSSREREGILTVLHA